MIVNDINLLLEDIEIEDEFYKYENDLCEEGAITKTAATIAGGTVTNMAGGGLVLGGLSAKSGGMILAGAGLANIGVLIGLAGIGYGLYRFFTRISRYESLIKKYQDVISKTQDPVKKLRLTNKLNIIKEQLAVSQARARKEKASIIKNTQELKLQIAEAQKNPNFDKQKLEKMKKKLNARMQLMSKIGAKI